MEFSHGTEQMKAQGIRISFIKHYEHKEKETEKKEFAMGQREFALKLSKVMSQLEKIYQ